MADSPSVMKLPFDSFPCKCVSVHRPTPLEVEKHHPWPQSDQIKKHGRVVDNSTVNLCPTAHTNVHRALSRRLKGEKYRLGNAYLESIVEAGLKKIRGE